MKVKTRTLLTNISYVRYKSEEEGKTNFVIDVFSFLTQNLNPKVLIENSRHRSKEIMLKWFGALVYRINSANLFI